VVLAVKGSTADRQSSLVESLHYTLAVLLLNRTSMETRIQDHLASRVIF
jgi:hypothetical protein